MSGLQHWIHILEEGVGARVVKIAAALLGFIFVALIYDARCFKNFSTPEAMDAAQVARNLAQGKGYTTSYVRPFSLHLVQQHRADRDALVKKEHPDLANAPVYPVLLAVLLKLAPVEYDISASGMFITYQPERWIAALNQTLLFLAAWLVFLIAERFFDRWVAWISVLVFLGADLFWRFSVSGSSTMLLIVLFLGISLCLATMDQWQREDAPSKKKIVVFGILTGVLLGLAGLTRYSFLWLIIPAMLFVSLFAPCFRFSVGAAVIAAFLAVATPWIVRNCLVSGTPFGTAGYAIFEQTTPFQGDVLERSLNPEKGFDRLNLNDFGRKLLINLRGICQNDLPKLGGSWMGAFFLVGLLLPFRNPSLSRLRTFLVLSLILFVVVQAWGRTQLSDVSKELSSENLLVVFAPLAFVFGVGFFFVLMDHLDLPVLGMRHALTTVVVVIASLPMIFSLLPPRSFPYSWPPYMPPIIQRSSFLLREDELMMSDIPWAVAWYGQRQCASLTLDYDKQFYVVHDDLKPVHGLLLSPQILESRFLTQMFVPTASNKKPWERFVWECISRGEVTGGFPLTKVDLNTLRASHLFMSDWKRWDMPPPRRSSN